MTGKPREVQGLLERAGVSIRRRAGWRRWLARTPVTPNMVSVAGAAMVVAAGVLYAWVGDAGGDRWRASRFTSRGMSSMARTAIWRE